MAVFLPSLGLIFGLVALMAAVRLTEQQARSTRMAVVELRDDERRLREAWGAAGRK